MEHPRCEKKQGAHVRMYKVAGGGFVWICNDCGKVVSSVTP